MSFSTDDLVRGAPPALPLCAPLWTDTAHVHSTAAFDLGGDAEQMRRAYEAVRKSWKSYTEEPAVPEPPPAPSRNPYARRTDAQCSSGPDPSSFITAADLLAIAQHRESKGYATGYRERHEVAAGQIERAYDEGWRAGMAEQHDAIASTFGERLHALHELLHLLPDAFTSYADKGARFAEFVQIAGAVTGSLIDDHAEGPYAEPTDKRRVPNPRAIDASGDDEGAAAALLDRVEQLRDWLKPFFDRELAAVDRVGESAE